MFKSQSPLCSTLKNHPQWVRHTYWDTQQFIFLSSSHPSVAMQLLFVLQMVVQGQDGVYCGNRAIKTYLRITQHHLLWCEKVKQTSAHLQARLRLAPRPTCRGRPKWEPQGSGHSPLPAFQGPTSVLSRYSRNSLKRGTRVVIHHPHFFRAWPGILHRTSVQWRWFPTVSSGHPPPPAWPLQPPDHSQPWSSQGARWAGLLVTHGIKPNTVPIKWSPGSPDHDLKTKQVTRNSLGPSGLQMTERPLSVMILIRKQ